MKNYLTIFYVFAGSVLFTFLFYDKTIGFNLFFFNVLVLFALWRMGKLPPTGWLSRVVTASTVVTAVFTAVHASSLVIFANLFSLFLLGGALLYPAIHSPFYSFLLSLANIFSGPRHFFGMLGQALNKQRFTRRLWFFFKVSVIPLAVVLLFALLYQSASPYFGQYVDSFFTRLSHWLDVLFEYFSPGMIFTWIFGLFVLAFLLAGKPWEEVVRRDAAEPTVLKAPEQPSGKNEKNGSDNFDLYVGLVLFSLLNLLILVVNFLDIVNIWFGFEWNGAYLKQFVHEGTYLLIFSILLSLLITFYIFHDKLNFHPGNRPLKILAYLWLFQNAVMTVSVGIRNYWYIHYFALAYKRIGVVFFLIFTLISIYLLYRKIRYRKTAFSLLNQNLMAFYVIFVVMSLFNWDNLIARYNFNHYRTSFVHLDFLLRLSDKALPYLDKTPRELEEIGTAQERLFHFEEKYLQPDRYDSIIESRKERFREEWPQKSWIEKNLSEEMAYRRLFKNY